MITKNEFYKDMSEGEGFDLEYYLPSLETDVILWVKLVQHGSVAYDGTFDYQPKFKVLGVVDTEDEPVVLSKYEISLIMDYLEEDYWNE